MSTLKIVGRKRVEQMARYCMLKVGLAFKSERLSRATDAEMTNLLAMLVALRTTTTLPGTPPIECVIFSKDRPMQLAALLSSMNEKVTPNFQCMCCIELPLKHTQRPTPRYFERLQNRLWCHVRSKSLRQICYAF